MREDVRRTATGMEILIATLAFQLRPEGPLVAVGVLLVVVVALMSGSAVKIGSGSSERRSVVDG